jgi:hypothetical protein
MLGIVKMNRDEYRKGNLAVRDYRITLFGFPIYVARFTSTNRDAIIKLTSMEEKTLRICGFTNNQKT